VSTLLGVHLKNGCMSKVHASMCSTTYVQPYGPRGLCHSQIPSATPPRLLRELERASSRRLRKSQEDHPTSHIPSEPNSFYNASHKPSISDHRVQQCSPRHSTRERRHHPPHITNANSCPRFLRHCRPAAPTSTAMVAHTSSNSAS
jgi:hypothetical protein